MIFKKDGEDVKTVSKFLIFVLAPVKTDKIKVDIQILWSPKFGTKIFLFFASIIPVPKIFNSSFLKILFIPIC